MENTVLEIQNISKIYKNKGKKIKAVDKVNLKLKKGVIYGLLGPNGAGKTTLIKMICGLITPTSGKIAVNRRSLGVVLEGSRNIYWRMTPRENLLYFGLLRGLKGKSLINRANYLINLLSLEDKKNTPVQNLSRGMQQKVAVAVALIHDPSLLLLDEPTLGIDVPSSFFISKFLKSIKRDKMILISSHQLDFIQHTCDEIIFMNAGKIFFSGSLNTLLKDYSFTHQYTINVITQFKKEIIEKELAKEELVNYFDLNESLNGQIKIKFKESSENLQKIIDFLRKKNIIIRSITYDTIELKEIFMKLVGDEHLKG